MKSLRQEDFKNQSGLGERCHLMLQLIERRTRHGIRVLLKVSPSAQLIR